MLDDVAGDANPRTDRRDAERQVLQQLEGELGLLKRRVVERHQADIEVFHVLEGRLGLPGARFDRDAGQAHVVVATRDHPHHDRPSSG